jgi:aminopeptidase N
VIDGGTGGRAGTRIQFVVPRGRGPRPGGRAEVTPRVVAALEDYFDMPYPYEKLDVAVPPRYWGTMEHPGIVAMGQVLTHDPARPRDALAAAVLHRDPRARAGALLVSATT